MLLADKIIVKVKFTDATYNSARIILKDYWVLVDAFLWILHSFSLIGIAKEALGATEFLLSPEKDPFTGRKNTSKHPQAGLNKQTCNQERAKWSNV